GPPDALAPPPDAPEGRPLSCNNHLLTQRHHLLAERVAHLESVPALRQIPSHPARQWSTRAPGGGEAVGPRLRSAGVTPSMRREPPPPTICPRAAYPPTTPTRATRPASRGSTTSRSPRGTTTRCCAAGTRFGASGTRRSSSACSTTCPRGRDTRSSTSGASRA